MGHGKETPRQKMIGMMYLVLTAMLALNVSADILNGFVLVDNGLVKTTKNFVAKNDASYSIFDAQMDKSAAKVGPYRDKAYSVKNMADQLTFDIQELKVEIVRYCDGNDAPSLIPAEWLIGEKRESKSTFEIDDALIKAKDNLDKPAEILMVKGKGAELKKKIEDFREHLLSLTTDLAVQKGIRESLNTDKMTDSNGTELSWESGHFEHIPMVAVVTMMSKMQSDIRNAEADIIQNLLAQIGASDTKVNKMEAIVQAKSSYVLRGNEYEARILLAAYDSLQKPKILLGPYRRTETGYEMVGEGRDLPYDARGRAVYRATGASVGNFTLQGLLQMPGPDGIVSYPFNAEYQVGEPSAVISATKMNVLYVGVDNPISISVSGVPSSAVSANMTNGTLQKSGNDWIARPTTPGTKSMVAVMANIEGQTKKMGEMEYRVKAVPNPVPTVAGMSGGKIPKATLAAQLAVVAEMKDFDFDLKFTVSSFSVTIVRGGNARSFDNKEARFSAEIKQQFEGLSKGAKVYIEDIKAVGPDRRTRELPTVIFTID